MPDNPGLTPLRPWSAPRPVSRAPDSTGQREVRVAADTPEELLAQLCADLRLLWRQAGGPSLRRLADRTGLGKSQVGAILAGEVRSPPDWDVVRALVVSFDGYAGERG